MRDERKKNAKNPVWEDTKPPREMRDVSMRGRSVVTRDAGWASWRRLMGTWGNLRKEGKAYLIFEKAPREDGRMGKCWGKWEEQQGFEDGGWQRCCCTMQVDKNPFA